MKTQAALVLVLLLGLPTLAYAQSGESYTEDQKWRLASVQLVRTLNSPFEGIQTQALKNTIIYATVYRDKVDLGDAVRVLRKVYEKDTDRTQRQLALAALQAIGSLSATNYLSRNVSAEEAAEGRLLMVSVVNDYYETRDTEATSSVGTYTAPDVQ